MERNLPRSHPIILQQVRPGRVYHRHIISLIACMTSAFMSHVDLLVVVVVRVRHTFNRIRLRKLRTLLHQRRRYCIPFLLGRKAQVDVCGGEVVGVELYPTFTIISPMSHNRVPETGLPGWRGRVARTYPGGIVSGGRIPGGGACHQTSQSQPNLISSSSGREVSVCGGWGKGGTNSRICLCLRRWSREGRLRWR